MNWLTFNGCISGPILLWCGRWKGLRQRHCGLALQGLPIRRHQHQWYQWRSYARAGSICWLVLKRSPVDWLVMTPHHHSDFAVGVSSRSSCRHLSRRWTVGCPLHFGGTYIFRADSLRWFVILLFWVENLPIFSTDRGLQRLLEWSFPLIPSLFRFINHVRIL